MDKFKLSLIALCALVAASTASANTSFFSVPSAKTSTNLKAHPPTDVTIVNASTDYIYVGVNGTNMHNPVQPGYNNHVYNYDSNVWSVPLVIYDPYNRTFFSNIVCRLAIVTVYGYPGNYRINTDSDLCN